jgi:hypothetical protein
MLSFNQFQNVLIGREINKGPLDSFSLVLSLLHLEDDAIKRRLKG